MTDIKLVVADMLRKRKYPEQYIQRIISNETEYGTDYGKRTARDICRARIIHDLEDTLELLKAIQKLDWEYPEMYIPPNT